jgi:NAD(P)-dependent dehydrogenase (short-subunit alcohol dehydrogenase family)
VSNELFDLTGRVALITASSRGIGLGIAQAMAARGASVVVSSRKADACEVAAKTIADAGGDALAFPCNVGHKDQLEGMVEATMTRWGHIDILVCVCRREMADRAVRRSQAL